MTPILISLALGLLACGDKDDTGPDPGDGGSTEDGGGTADGGTADGGGTTDGGSSDGGSSDGGGSDGGGSDGGGSDGGSSDGGSEEHDYATGIELVDEDSSQFAAWSYTWSTYQVTADFEEPFTTADGLPPRFHVIWPSTPGDGDPYSVLLILHGSATDVDDEVPEGLDGRCTQAHGTEQAVSLVTRSTFVQQALFDGFVVVVPENGFCDGWAGLGPEDPNDPEHAGYFLQEVAMGFLRWGQTRLAVDDGRIYVVGTSLGATGSPVFATYYDAVAGIIYDSGAPDFVRYTEDETYSGVDLETRQARGYHVMGGSAYETDGSTPSSLYPRYLGHSLDRGLAEGARPAAPVFVIANAQDTVAPSEMYDGIETVFEDAGVDRWTYHDVDHGDPLHTQIHSPGPTYTTWAAVRFALGHHVRFLEVEGHSGSGWVGADVLDETPYAQASGGDVRIAGRGEAGTLVELDLPTDAVGGVSATVFLTISGASIPGDTAASIVLSSAADGLVDSTELSQDSADWGSNDAAAVRTRLVASTVSGPVSGSATLTIEVSGLATVAADIVVVDWD